MALAVDLVGKLVEIHGFTAALEQDAYLRDAGPDTGLIPNGKIGRAMAFDRSSGKFAVDTFDGFLLGIGLEHLKEYVSKTPAEGGFDVTWPADEGEFVGFAPTVMQALREKGYCKIQMYMGDRQRSKAMDETEDLKFTKMKSELELAYLGRSKESQVCWMGAITDPNEETQSTLQAYDQYFGTFCQLIEPLTAPALGFAADCRTNSMVRMPLTDQKIKQTNVDDDDIEGGLLDSHISFCRRRQLCMMMVVESAGADLTLIPQDPAQANVPIPVEKGQLIVFNHAHFSYEYKPSTLDDMLLQSWVLANPPPQQLEAVHADLAAKDAAIGLFTGPKTPSLGNRICIMSLMTGLPGNAHDDPEKWWTCLAPGTDSYIRAPLSRFDIDPYFLPNEEWRLGYTYACHAGFVGEDIYSFDNKFFNVSDEEAMICNPNMRKGFEHGYQCLWAAGFNKDSMRKAHIGTYVGNSGDDWNLVLGFTMGDQDVHRNGLSHRSFACMWNQVPYCFGLKGPSFVVDTACSSALVAYNIAHTEVRQPEKNQNLSGSDTRLSDILCMGSNLIPGPGNFVNLCGPHMLSPTGRCYTFDHSADGFARGEGTGCFSVRALTQVADDCVGVIIGACTNQDGRSASLTAPNGPSQSACIKKSMQEAGNSPNEITCAECHGTGTALGDPIEVGALRGIMGDRVLPLMESSAKAHIGHLEACAGMAGVLKCFAMNQACVGSPSPHLGELNPNLDVAGYPTIFCTELVSYGINAGNTGVSSFGWGGANARADVWAPCQKGANKINKSAARLPSVYVDYMEARCPIDDGPMYHLDGGAVPSEFSEEFRKGRHTANCIRDEFDAYDSSVFTGTYQVPPEDEEVPVKPAGGPVCIVGSWTAYTTMQEMDFDEEKELYSFIVPLGETRCEMFHMVVDLSPEQHVIYPVVDRGSMHTRVIGPDLSGSGKNWLLDGRDDEVPSGSLYKICLKWDAKLQVTWERLPDTETSTSLTKPKDFAHAYQILGTFTGWTPHTMSPVKGEPGCYETRMKITGNESFQFMRDLDNSQKIYPSRRNASDGSIPVRGPDEMGEGKKFYVDIAGTKEEIVTFKLKVIDGHITVEAQQQAKTTTWESIEGPGRHSYSVKGSWNHFDLTPMTPMLLPGVYTCQGVVQSMEEFFTILVDEDSNFQLYPEMSAAPGKATCKGPDGSSKEKMWQILALKPGAQFEIKLDFRAVNKKERVTLRWLTDPVDAESMQVYLNSYYS